VTKSWNQVQWPDLARQDANFFDAVGERYCFVKEDLGVVLSMKHAIPAYVHM